MLVSRGRAAAAAPSTAHAVATVVSGPDAPKEFRLRPGVSYIGRDPGCEVRLNDALVSRRHAKLLIGEAIEIVDEGSANGLRIGGAPASRAVVRVDDVVGVGETELKIQPLHPGATAPGMAASRSTVRRAWRRASKASSWKSPRRRRRRRGRGSR